MDGNVQDRSLALSGIIAIFVGKKQTRQKTVIIMRTRFLMLLAAVLLGGASVTAQSVDSGRERGDVNGDGQVDVFDIVELANIIMGQGKEGETVYYWYVGQTQPTSQSAVTLQDSGTFINNNWHTINTNNTYTFSNPIYNSEANPISGNSNTYWYIALPADKSYGIYDSDDVNEVADGNIAKLSSQITVANVTYNVYKTVGTYRKFNDWWIY